MTKESMQADGDAIADVSNYDIQETRDRFLAQRVFLSMSPAARDFLWDCLELDQRPDRDEIPDRWTGTGREFLWHELVRATAKNGGRFFLLTERDRGESFDIFVGNTASCARSFAASRASDRAGSNANGTEAGDESAL